MGDDEGVKRQLIGAHHAHLGLGGRHRWWRRWIRLRTGQTARRSSADPSSNLTSPKHIVLIWCKEQTLGISVSLSISGDRNAELLFSVQTDLARPRHGSQCFLCKHTPLTLSGHCALFPSRSAVASSPIRGSDVLLLLRLLRWVVRLLQELVRRATSKRLWLIHLLASLGPAHASIDVS